MAFLHPVASKSESLMRMRQQDLMRLCMDEADPKVPAADAMTFNGMKRLLVPWQIQGSEATQHDASSSSTITTYEQGPSSSGSALPRQASAFEDETATSFGVLTRAGRGRVMYDISLYAAISNRTRRSASTMSLQLFMTCQCDCPL